jgi:hypothetical protein
MKYWTRRGQKARLSPPTGVGQAQWREERLIKDGFAKRGQVHFLKKGGHTVFKGENISASHISGEPVHTKFDVSKTSSPSIWAYPEILSHEMFAIPIIEQVPVAAPFNPATVAMENTVVLFGPRDDLASVPFDVLLLSNVYAFFHVVGNRRSYQNKIRGHIYGSAVADLPWSEELVSRSKELSSIRTKLLNACERRYQQSNKLQRDATALGLRPLKNVVRAKSGAKIGKGDAFAEEPEVTLLVGATREIDGVWVLPLDASKKHTIEFNNKELAQLAAHGLSMLDGTEVSWTSILAAPIPSSSTMSAALTKLQRSYDPDAVDAEIDALVANIDSIVGPALGLTKADINTIQSDMAADPFLRLVRPRFPFLRPRQYGRRTNLERSDRYSTGR